MSLTNRLIIFYLLALGFVLTSFSFAIYFSVQIHLNQQLEAKAAATLETLLAASEVHRDGLEWEPEQHTIQFWHEDSPTIWAVFNENQAMIDSSKDLKFPADQFSQSDTSGNEIGSTQFSWQNEQWQVFQLRLKAPIVPEKAPRLSSNRHREFVFMTAWPLRSMTYSLNYLKWMMCSVTLTSWLIAAVLGRWFCQKALLPLTEMAEDVSRISVNQLSFRLQEPPVNDELLSLSKAFNGLMNRLEDSFSRQSRFTSEASHQMRTPLAAMMGQIEVALRRDRPPEEYKRVLCSAKSQAVRLQKIVELLLFLARADAETNKLSLELVHVNHWLADHIKSHWGEHPRFHNIQIHLPESTEVLLRTHFAMLGQALDNYIDNAMKYSAPGTPVHVRLEEHSNHVSIIVQDEGQGIHPEDLSNIFSPFFRSSDARSRGVDGFGLGLAISARLTHALGGECSVTSKPGQGSRFIMSFHNTGTDPTGQARQKLPTETQEFENILFKSTV